MFEQLDNAVQYIMLHHRWIFVTLFLLPVSVVYEVYIFARNWLVYRLNTASLLHDKRVQYVQRQVREWRAKGEDRPMCTARPSWQTMNLREALYKQTMYNIKINLPDILEVNLEKKFVRVEPMVTMGQLSAVLNPQGWTIPVVPELEDITVGGVVMGTGIESSSHKFGLIQHICRAYELVLADGSTVKCSREERSDLFYSVPWSYGTIGFLVSVELDIIPTGKFVKLEYEPIYKLREFCQRLDQVSHDESYDYVDAILFTPDEGVIMTGRMVDEDEGGKVNVLSRWYKPWFFKHVESKLKDKNKSTEYIPLRDYHHRYTRGLFWEIQDIIPFGNNPIFRFFLGWTMPPKISLLKMTQTKSIKKLYQKFHVLQDILVPMEGLDTTILNVDKLFKIYPIWLCPFKLRADPGLVHSPTKSDCMYVDVGVYGGPKTADYEVVASHKKLEKYLASIKGIQMLYADIFHTRDEFRKMFDHTLYDKVRESLQCEKAFPELYDKVNRKAKE